MVDQVNPKIIENYQVDSGVAIWFLGGPSLAIRTKETLVYLDLFVGLSPVPDVVTRDIPDMIDPALIEQADYAISTHHDEDHCNEYTLKILHEHGSVNFLGPVSCNKLYRDWGFDLHRTRLVAPYERFSKKDLTIHALPSKDAFDPDAVCYLFETEGVRIFESGDSLYFEGLADIGQSYEIDIAFLSTAENPPGKVYYMDDEAVLKAASDLKAKIVVLKHYDLWRQFKKDPRPLVEKLRLAGQDARIFELGACFEYGSE